MVSHLDTFLKRNALDPARPLAGAIVVAYHIPDFRRKWF
jgi:hypothetical protein